MGTRKQKRDQTDLSPGDRVRWNSHGSKAGKGEAQGTVVRKITRTTKLKGHTAKATPDEPQFIVESDNGGRAAHKPSALREDSS